MSSQRTARRGSGLMPPPRRRYPSPWLTVEEAGEALGVSAMTVRRRIKAKQFPAVVIASVTRVPRTFVDKLIDSAEAGETVVVEEYATQWPPGTDVA